ncbi:MAG: hydrogenase-1 expression HyaE [Pseudomonadota bacterium]|nr:hydrogenase-1 expression HyaE [Pseudomonadota bacterium]
MTSPLIQRLFDEFDYPEITEANHDAFVSGPGMRVLFFAGDPERYRETTDVAVVIPELVQAFAGQFHPGVVAAGDELVLQKRYGFTAWPALVFLRSEGYLGVITGIRNWSEYLEEISTLFTAEVKRAPSIGVPLVGV